MSDKVQAGQGKAQPVAEKTLKAYRHYLDDFIIPFFKNVKLTDIKPGHIKKFRDSFIDKGFSNSVINLNCTILKIIISYARADGLITTDPFVSVPMMYVNARSKGAFTKEQLVKTFSKNWDSKERKIFSMIAAVTGMRISEISAIRKETLFSNYIDIKDQLLDNKISPVKDGEKRKLRICSELYKMISDCIRRNGNFAFTEAQDTYRQTFYDYAEIPTYESRQKSKLSFHSLRHFVNTTLLTSGISEIKVKSVLGHSSGKGSMSERYANFRPEDFDDVAIIQRELISIFSKQ
jgi:integrase